MAPSRQNTALKASNRFRILKDVASDQIYQ